MEESDDVHAALALMYGYAAKYAPSTVIEARIDALVVHQNLLLLFYGFTVIPSYPDCLVRLHILLYVSALFCFMFLFLCSFWHLS